MSVNIAAINEESRFWCITHNNYAHQYVALPDPAITYMVSGKEKGERGTKHLQIYVELNRSRRRSFVAKIFPLAHVEVRRGSAEQAANYCKKEGNFVEFGKMSESKQGKRNDLLRICEGLKEGKTLQEVALENPTAYIRNYRGIQMWQNMVHNVAEFRENLEVFLFVGKTRLGKSYHARVTLGCFAKPVGKGLWWDGYNGQKRVVIDEFRGQYPLSDVLQITDPYKMQVETKGGHIFFEPEMIVFTTNTNPRDMYENHDEATREAFLARFHKVYYWYAKQKFIIMTDKQKQAYFESNTIPVIPIENLQSSDLQKPEPTKGPTILKRKATVVDLTDEPMRPPYRWNPKTNCVEKNQERQPKVDELIPATPWQSLDAIEETHVYESEEEEETHISDTDMSSILSEEEDSF